MRIGIFGTPGAGSGALDELIAVVRQAHDDGFSSFWTSQIFNLDALTAFAVVGREVPDITLGTGVVPTFPRHPQVLAQQALTVSQAIGPRLRLGIGLSHQIVVENMWGYSYARPLQHMKEYLAALVPMLEGKPASVQGQQVVSNTFVETAGSRPELLVAALGEKMLRLCGAQTDGTVTWMTGPKTIAGHVAPTLRAAAEAAGRPEPQIVTALPLCVTDEPAKARETAGRTFAIYGTLPSYRAMLDREGVEGPAGVTIAGDEAACREALDELVAAGVTEFGAAEFGSSEERARTRAFLRSVKDAY